MELVGSIIVVVGLGTGFELKAGANEMQGVGMGTSKITEC